MACSLFIPHWHPAPLNKVASGHWSNGHRLKKADRQMVAAYAMQQRTPKAEGKRRVTLTIVLAPGRRGCDPDAYWKSLLDALVHAGLLVGDNPNQVVLNPVIFQRGVLDRWGTLIELEHV